jgi:DNA-binding response OmpR family regulator
MNYEQSKTNSQFTILVADRNPRIREFLAREFESSGYQVLLAGDGRDVLRRANVLPPFDLLILDLDITYPSGLTILKKMQARKSPLPIVVHASLEEHKSHPLVQRTAGICRKKGNNVAALKEMVGQILRKAYPNRFSREPPGEGQPITNFSRDQGNYIGP